MAHDISNIFISYGRADARDLAIRLRDDLQAIGYSVWLDTSEIAGGESWSENIENAIEHCHLVLALMSPASFQSQWCRAEQLRATRKGKRIIPLLAVANAEIPLHLEHINYLNFSQAERYGDAFRDLMSDIRSGSAFLSSSASSGTASPYRRGKVSRRNDEKRDAASFRRYLKDLRQEDWLGARFWWSYFLFHFTDIHTLADMLKEEELRSPFGRGLSFNSRFDKFVRLYFRPRTPDLFHAEGFRPSSLSVNSNRYAPIPAYLLFDMESLICHPDSRFSDGDPDKVQKTYTAFSYFRELPFEQIYHDSWFMPDEREEIMRYREAQVLIPDKVGLEALQLIWLRSAAEYETLHQLLPRPLWHKWRDKVTVRADYHLFNHKRSYVSEAVLAADSIRLRFNDCQQDCEAFMTQVIVEGSEGQRYDWQDAAFMPNQDLLMHIPKMNSYTVQLLWDGDLAYMGKYDGQSIVS